MTDNVKTGFKEPDVPEIVRKGIGLEDDGFPSTAMSCFMQAREDKVAQYRIARIILEEDESRVGISAPLRMKMRNVSAEALPWLEKSAGQGYAPAQCLLADNIHRWESGGGERAAALRQEAASQGYVPAMADLGRAGRMKYSPRAEVKLAKMYAEGLCFERSLAKARELLMGVRERGRWRDYADKLLKCVDELEARPRDAGDLP